MSKAQAPARKIPWGDILAVAAVLLLAAGGFIRQATRPAQGDTATVVTPDATLSLPLDEETSLTLTGRDGRTLTVEVADGAARVAASDCPDQVCVRTGWLSRPGETAACVPAGILLRIDGENPEEVDAVAY